MQWYWCLLPRIRSHLPAPTILDIGPGHGRWTRYLLEHCERMVLVDLSDRSLAACRERFGSERVSYHLGSGECLSGVESESVDFVFSWEALVYVEVESVGRYLEEIARVLKPQGTAFIHHSNLLTYQNYFEKTLKLPRGLRFWLKRRGWLDFDQWRARSVSAPLFSSLAQRQGLAVVGQELLPWGGKRLIDGLTTLQKSAPQGPSRTTETPNFHTAAYDIQRLSWMYGEGVPW